RGASEAPRGCRGGGGGRHLRRVLPCRARGRGLGGVHRRARGGALMTTPQGLAAEDAAVYGYGLVLSGAGPSIRAAATRELTAHRARRDAAEALWPDAPPAPTGYSTSEDTSLSPVRLAIRLESDCGEARRAEAAIADPPARRRTCADALTAAAVQLARWRTLAPGAPSEAPPGFPRS